MDNYDEVLNAMSVARDRHIRLVEDLTIAHYKGYGSTGGTTEEINEELDRLEVHIEELQGALDALDA